MQIITMHAEKVIKNICGHESWYRIKVVENGMDIESDVNGLCSTCLSEDAHFKAQIAEIFHKMFEGG